MNVLVYYHQDLSPFHSRAKGILEMGLRREAPLCICPQVLMEFYATITNPRRVTDPVPPEQGLAEVEKYFTCSWLGKIYPKEETLEITIDLLKNYRVSRILADQIFIAYAAPGSKTEGFVHSLLTWGKPLWTLPRSDNAAVNLPGVSSIPPDKLASRANNRSSSYSGG